MLILFVVIHRREQQDCKKNQPKINTFYLKQNENTIISDSRVFLITLASFSSVMTSMQKGDNYTILTPNRQRNVAGLSPMPAPQS